MAVTAKQIADQLGISAAAVSLALNNRRGVSEKHGSWYLAPPKL